MAETQASAQLIKRAEHLLLDFDGPVCTVYAGFPADRAASRLKTMLVDSGAVLPPDIVRENDPLEVFRFSAQLGPDVAKRTHLALIEMEVQAIQSAKPTTYSHDVLLAAHRTGRTVSIVSNNSTAAITSYLTNHHLIDYIDHILGRTSPDPGLLKPSPYLLRKAISELKAQPRSCIFVGDSTSDIHAAHSADIAAIGYANKPSKSEQLASAGADAIVTTMADIATALNARPTLPRL